MNVFSVTRSDNFPETPIDEVSSQGQIKLSSIFEVTFDPEKVVRSSVGSWEFLWYGEYNASPDFERVTALLDGGFYDELWGNRGILISINVSNNSAYIFNDCYGSFPIYFSESSTTKKVIISSSIVNFSGRPVDWTSFYQFLCFGYIIGGYSIFQDVDRLKANSCLAIRWSGDEISIRSFYLRNFWQPLGRPTDKRIDDIIDILYSEASNFGSPQIMMSGGWDSRLLLSVLKEKVPVLFTHGNLKSREVEIVREIASLSNLPLNEQDISGISFNSDKFKNYLAKNESAMFTHWSAAGLYREKNNLVMTAGTFGEVLGGHYGTINSLPGKTKYISLFMHMLGCGMWFDARMGLRDSDTVADYLEISNYRVFWLIKDAFSKDLKGLSLLEKSNERLHSVFSNYKDQGVESGQDIYERFYTEHRGAQYINLQLSNAAGLGSYRNVFTNKDLVGIVSSIPFGFRAHNKLNKKIIRKMYPELLQYPLASTLTKASRPMVIQEASRAYRKLIEKNSSFHFLYKATSKYGERPFGWNDFRSVMNSDFIEMANTLLTENIWNHDEVRKVFNLQGGENMYPLFDMISKAITLDFWIKNP